MPFWGVRGQTATQLQARAGGTKKSRAAVTDSKSIFRMSEEKEPAAPFFSQAEEECTVILDYDLRMLKVRDAFIDYCQCN